MIKKAQAPLAQPSEEDEQPLSGGGTIDHTIQIIDLPSDPSMCMVKVALLGETEKIYYEKLWDVYRKIKACTRS